MYAFAAAALLVFVVPVTLLAGLAVGLGAGVLLGLHRSLAVLSGHAREVRVLRPQAVPGAAGERDRPDYAWPHYFAAQVRLDATAAARLTRAALRRAWTWTARPLSRGDTRRIAWCCLPVLLPVFAVLTGASLGAAGVVVVLV